MRYVLLALIRLYQRTISPLLGPRCRFYPSCSAYAYQALKIHGVVYGSYLAVRRLLRCHPWNPGGVDMVPPKREHPWWRLRRTSAATVPESQTTPQGV